MWTSNHWQDYELLDCGGGRRLERWGKQILVRPDPQAIWQPEGSPLWQKADAVYHRSKTGGGHWEVRQLPEHWTIHYQELAFNIKPMSVEDAILEMNLLGHSFYMFNNIESGKAATVYRRKDGGCGLIELDDL